MSPAEATRAWVTDFVVRLGLCPFAARPLREGRVAYVTCPEEAPEAAFYWAGTQVQGFITDGRAATETSLLIFPRGLDDFDAFLDFVDEVEFFLDDSGAASFVQLAHFHPLYCFADVPEHDPGNATNRSPYPVVQLLRVDSVTAAVEGYPDVEGIPARNVALLRRLAEEQQ